MKKSDFKTKICRDLCLFCDNDTDPKFCFNRLFENNESAFKSTIVFNIMQYSHQLDVIMNESNKNIKKNPYLINRFEAIFCFNNVCKNCKQSKKSILRCIRLFKRQYNTIKMDFSSLNKVKIVLPEVAILISNNEVFKERVKYIFENNT